MIKRISNLLLTISLVFSMVSSLFTPVVTYAASSNSNIIDQSSTSSGNLSSVAFGNGVFVAVGDGGISTSSNGVDWSIIPNKTGIPNLKSIVFGNGKFIAIASGEKSVYTSLDGQNWTRNALSITPERLKAVNGKFFVWQSEYINGTNPPSYNVTLLQSSDGVVWTDTRIVSTNTIFGMQMLTDIAFGQNKYVVSANNAVYYTSTDLLNWTTVTLTNLVINYYNSSWPLVTNIIYLNNRFFSYIVTPFAKKVFTSTDGANWTVDASWDAKQFYGGAFLNGSYLLYGQGVIYKSDLAPLSSTQWSALDTHTTMMVNNMVFGNGKYVASGGNGLLVSSDLSAWSNVSGDLKSIATNDNGNYVAVSSGEYGSIYKASGSAAWSDVTPSKLPGMNAVTYGAGKFIAVTNRESYNLNAKVVTSANGDTWTVADSGVQDNLTGVAFGANQFVAVSEYGGIYASSNGGTWSEKFKNEDIAFNSVAYLNNQFIALGIKYNSTTYDQESVVIAKSSDGLQWGVPQEIGYPNTSLKGIAYDGRSYILVGEDTLSQQAVVLTTVDLITFVKASISASALNNISFGNGSFLAVGLNGEMFTSVDGTTWTPEASDLTSNLNSIVFDGTNFKVVGVYFTKMTIKLGPALAHSISTSSATLTPVAGIDNAITLTVKNSLGDTDIMFTGVKEVTVSGYGAAPDGTYGSVDGIALTASPSKLNVNFIAGVAQVNLKLNQAEAQAVVFSQAGVASPAATALNIAPVAGDSATMKLTTGVSAPQKNGGNFAQQPVITLLDAFGNISTSDNSTTVSVSKKDAGSWTLTGNLTQTAVAGVVSFTDLGATNSAGITGAQLAFDATGLAQITSTVIDLTWPELAAPSIESVTAGDEHIHITWSPVYGANGYAIYQYTTPGVYGAEIATVSASDNSYDAVGLTNGTAYYFIVKAINPESISAASNEVTRTPQVPAPGAPILHPPVPSNGIIGLTWDPVKGAIGYTVYQGIISGIYETKVATVSESVYNYDVTGLTNGESYYFVVKASNPGGESAASNEVSTKPRTIPSAPTNLIAVAGDGEATVTFAVPDSNGGTPITKYEVTASPGNIVTIGAASPITVTGLANGTTYSFTVKAINGAGTSVASEVSNSVTPKSSTDVEVTPTPAPTTPAPTETPTPTGPVVPVATATPAPSSSAVEILVNGKVENAGTMAVSEQNGQTVTTIVVDQAKIEQSIDKEGPNAIITIPVAAASDVIVGELNGQIIKDLEQKQGTLIISTPKATYTLSAAQIDISAILNMFGTGIHLQDLKVQISISVLTADVLKRIEALAAREQLTLVAQPLDFTVKVTYGGKTIDVSRFNSFMERMIPLVDGVDLNKITTGLVLEAGDSIRQVPTQIVVKDGNNYAQIHSLTNSTYFVVQNSKSFKDVTNHWAKDIVNEMASRKVINGIGDDLFNPDQEITRAEFAAIIVRGLGLKLESGSTSFTDVKISDWFNDTVQTAYSYKLINGFEYGTFRPTDKITREQAMSIIAKAMVITDLKSKLLSKDSSELLRSFTDANKVSDWAKSSIVDSLQAGIITGRNGKELAPKAYITRAEVAAIIQRLLQQSDLI